MIKEHLPHLLAEEAANSNTPSTQLERLSLLAELKSLVAANPSTPTATLTNLSRDDNAAVRRAVAQNPNTSESILRNLVVEFPRAFLDNPALPLLTLSNPNFLYALSERIWLRLLSCDNIPLALLQWLQKNCTEIKNDHGYKISGQSQLQAQLALHIAVAGEVSGKYEEEAARTAGDYYTQLSPFYRPIFIPFFASSPGSPDQWLPELSVMDSEQKAWFVRYHPGVNAGFLHELAKIADPELQHAIALHPMAPASLLSELASSATPKIRRAVARNPQAPGALLHQLAGDKNHLVRRAVAAHPHTALGDLAKLARDTAATVRAAIAAHPRVNAELSRLLLGDAKHKVRRTLAGNPSVPRDVLVRLAGDCELVVTDLPETASPMPLKVEHEYIRSSLAGNPRLPRKLLLQLTDDPSWQVRTQVAANPGMSLPLLEKLILTGKLPWEGIARNPHVTPAFLTQLAQDGNDNVRAAVAAHEQTPTETLNWLAGRSTPALKRALAVNPHTPLNVLKQLLVSSPFLLVKIVENPAARNNPHIFSDQLLNMLQEDIRRDWHSTFRKLFFKHEAFSASHLQQFAASSYWQDRYQVALNPATLPAVLDDLTRDGNRYVRAVAREAVAKRAGEVLS